MRYQNYIFDLYGTLVDIHTDESDEVLWERFACLLAMRGASYAPEALHALYLDGVAQAEADARRARGALAEIDLAPLFLSFYTGRGVRADERDAAYAAQAFRMLSLRKLRLFPAVREMLATLRAEGRRVYLLSNAQAHFTRPELTLLGLSDAFDGSLLSSEVGYKKPDPRFFGALLERYALEARESVMVGNDAQADCHGAAAVGLDSLYVHTEQSPALDAPLPANCRCLSRIAQVTQTL